MDPRPARAFGEHDDSESSYVSKLKVRYLIEKNLNGQWILMARMSSGVDLDRLREIGFAFGGWIRVQDVQLGSIALQEQFE